MLKSSSITRINANGNDGTVMLVIRIMLMQLTEISYSFVCEVNFFRSTFT